MVILGNLPYSGESINKGNWILSLLDDYKKEPTGGQLQEKNSKWINDDYVKFIRFGQHFIEKTAMEFWRISTITVFWTIPLFGGCVTIC
jgi:hypothetical protein